MQEILPVAAVLGAILIGAVSPGPSFVVVAVVAGSRRDGLAAALGMGVGGVAFAVLALLGLHAVIAQVEWLHLGLRIAGGLFLLHLAVRLWRGAAEPLVVPEGAAERTEPARAFWRGLATQLSNPKTAIVYGSIFAALLPPGQPTWVVALLPALVLVVEAGWYALVAVAFSASGARGTYRRAKAGIDRAAAAVMGALGLKLMVEAARGP